MKTTANNIQIFVLIVDNDTLEIVNSFSNIEDVVKHGYDKNSMGEDEEANISGLSYIYEASTERDLGTCRISYGKTEHEAVNNYTNKNFDNLFEVMNY